MLSDEDREALRDAVDHTDDLACGACNRTLAIVERIASDAARAAERALVDRMPRLLTVPDEESMYGLLAALNYGQMPELACTWKGLAFVATLTDPGADYVNYIHADESGLSRCPTSCENCGTADRIEDPWKPVYPVVAILSQMPDLDRAAEDEIEEADWLRTALRPEAATTEGAVCDHGNTDPCADCVRRFMPTVTVYPTRSTPIGGGYTVDQSPEVAVAFSSGTCDCGLPSMHHEWGTACASANDFDTAARPSSTRGGDDSE